MEGLPTKPGWVNPEFVTTHDKDILLISLYANEPENANPRKRLTMLHLAAIIHSERLLEDPEMYRDIKVNPDKLMVHAAYLNDFINKLKIALKERLDSGINYGLIEVNKWILKDLEKTCPEIDEDKLEEGYELIKFLDLLKRGINYETQYLTMLEEKFAKVSDAMKKAYSVYEL